MAPPGGSVTTRDGEHARIMGFATGDKAFAASSIRHQPRPLHAKSSRASPKSSCVQGPAKHMKYADDDT